MVKLTQQNESIEGAKQILHTRQHNPSGIKKIQNKSYYKYKLGIISEARIIQELNPKVFFYKSNSKLDLNDCLECQSIEVYSLKLLKFSKQTNYTSTHSIFVASSSKDTASEIIVPFRSLLNKISIKDNKNEKLI